MLETAAREERVETSIVSVSVALEPNTFPPEVHTFIGKQAKTDHPDHPLACELLEEIQPREWWKWIIPVAVLVVLAVLALSVIPVFLGL